VQVMETSLRVLGQEHPSTLTRMANLAWTWKSQDRYTEAVDLMALCMVLRAKVLGDEHHHTKESVQTLQKWQSLKLGGPVLLAMAESSSADASLPGAEHEMEKR